MNENKHEDYIYIYICTKKWYFKNLHETNLADSAILMAKPSTEQQLMVADSAILMAKRSFIQTAEPTF